MVSKGRSFTKSGAYTILFIVMGGILLIAGYASWKQFERHKRITAEVTILEGEKERVKKENESLQERIKYFATESFQEQESKERLNMRKDNEFVIDIERVEKQREETESSSVPLETRQAIEPNYKKWWAKLF